MLILAHFRTSLCPNYDNNMQAQELTAALTFVAALLEPLLAYGRACLDHITKCSRCRGLNYEQTEQHVPVCRWPPLLPSRLALPDQIPATCENNFVLVDGGVPAMLLTNTLFAKIQQFAEDFRRLQQLEKMYAVEIKTANDQIDLLTSDRAELRRRRDMLTKVLRDEEAKPIGQKTFGYTWSEVNRVNKDYDRGRDWSNKWFYKGEAAYKEMQAVRMKTLEKQYELANMICAMLNESNVLSATEQWTQDRRALHTPDLREIHLEANDMSRFPKVLKFVTEDMISRSDSDRSDWSQGGSEALPSRQEKLQNAMNDFERCHWNRLVAKNEFAERRTNLTKIRQSQGRLLLVNEDAM